MMRSALGRFTLVSLLFVQVFFLGSAQASSKTHQDKLLLISAGEVTGYYYPVAGAICRIINKDHPDGFSCAVVPSSGSAANLTALKAGEVDMAIVQARAAVLAGSGSDGIPAVPELRALMGLHGESAVVAVRSEAGINAMADLKGRRINLGRSGSFQRSMAEMVLTVANLPLAEVNPLELDANEQAVELCEGTLDAAVFVGIHPITDLAQVMESCDVTLLPIAGDGLDGLLRKNPWLARSIIHRATYEGQDADLSAFQVRAILVATTAMPSATAKLVVEELRQNLTALSRLHPVLSGLSVKNGQSEDGIPISWHEGMGKARPVPVSADGFSSMMSVPIPPGKSE